MHRSKELWNCEEVECGMETELPDKEFIAKNPWQSRDLLFNMT